MKAILALFLICLVVNGNPSSAIDINEEPLILPRGSSTWFKMKIKDGHPWQTDSNDPDLLFIDVGNSIADGYQFFHVACKRSCQSGETYSFFLTETRVGNAHSGEPLATLAYILYVS